jgi:hypothetical protein
MTNPSPSPDKAVHVPPPPHRVVECLSAWERYLHQDEAQGLVLLMLMQEGVLSRLVPNVVAVLGQLGLVRELSGRKRGRVFAYAPMLKLLEKGT